VRGGSGAPDGDRADDERQPVRTVDELVAAAMAGDSDTVNRLLAAAPGLRERARAFAIPPNTRRRRDGPSTPNG